MDDQKQTPEQDPETLPSELEGTDSILQENDLSALTEKPLPLDESMQPSDQPQDEEKVEDALPLQSNKKMPGWLKKGIIWFVVFGLVFLAGIILVNITSVAPMRNNLREVTSENLNLKADINELENTLANTEEELADTKSQLSDTRESLSETHDMLVSVENQRVKQENLFELKYHVALTRVAVATQDKLSARQSLLLAEENLEALKTKLDAEIYEILEERLSDAKQYTSGNFTKAAEELRILTENLERIK